MLIIWKICLVSGSVFFIGFTEDEEGLSRVAGSSIFTFQKVRRGHSMAQTGESVHNSLINTQSLFICKVKFIQDYYSVLKY